MTQSTINLGREIVNEKMFLYARPDADEDNGFKLILVPEIFKYYTDASDVMIDVVSVEYMPPGNLSYQEMVIKAVETLRDKQKQILASAHRSIAQLDDKINTMLLLTHQSTSDDIVLTTPDLATSSSSSSSKNDIPF